MDSSKVALDYELKYPRWAIIESALEDELFSLRIYLLNEKERQSEDYINYKLSSIRKHREELKRYYN